ncbi:hypothetical protein [Photobacterium angustum]|uniref:hypothetical protein n=1 Tax=Photobacterium angustum TaxID=661 RepID=UPI0005E6354F|nr:hypothetical protein [Photobacterium angustum]KJG00118.1 hypothetical protein UB35_19915 [Photobacterium angustum]PSV61679.1 hypothetical protein CTM95_20470 [Photobacterium angustum]
MTYGLQFPNMQGGGTMTMDTFQPTTMIGFFAASKEVEEQRGSTGWRFRHDLGPTKMTGVDLPAGVRIYAVPWVFDCDKGVDSHELKWDQNTKTLSGHIQSKYFHTRHGRTEVVVGIFADYSHCDDKNQFGLWAVNNGVSSMLTGNYAPLALVGRKSFPVKKGGNNSTDTLKIPFPEFGSVGRDLKWYRGAIFTGTRHQAPYLQSFRVDPRTKLMQLEITPVDGVGLSWFTDMRTSTRYVNRNMGWKQNDELKVAVFRERHKVPTGWGMIIYKPNGAISSAFDDQPPLICKGATGVPQARGGTAGDLDYVYPIFKPTGTIKAPIMYPPIMRDSVGGTVPVLSKKQSKKWQSIHRAQTCYYLENMTFKPSLINVEFVPSINKYDPRLQSQSTGNGLSGAYETGFIQMSDYFNL